MFSEALREEFRQCQRNVGLGSSTADSRSYRRPAAVPSIAALQAVIVYPTARGQLRPLSNLLPSARFLSDQRLVRKKEEDCQRVSGDYPP
jgi:hypothetical protein